MWVIHRKLLKMENSRLDEYTGKDEDLQNLFVYRELKHYAEVLLYSICIQ